MRRKRKNKKRQGKTKKDEDAPTDVLSQDDIDQLLEAINTGISDKDEDRKPSTKLPRRIKIYDFKRPDKFSKDQIRTMSILHEVFARLTTTSLSAQLRSMVHVHVASVDQLTYEEFIRSIPTPTTLAIVNMPSLKGAAIVEIDPTVSFSMINRSFGGYGANTKHQHELTPIEQIVMENIIVHSMLPNLREAWSEVLDINPDLSKIETQPQFIQLVPPTEMIVLITLEVRIEDIEGMINIAYPYNVTSGIMDKLTSAFWFGNRSIPSKNYQLVKRDSIPIKLTAEVFRRDYPIKEIISWKEETILLPLCTLASSNCYLRFGGRRVWQCRLLPDHKWFPKQIEIIGFASLPSGTEGKKVEKVEKVEKSKINAVVADALVMAEITISVELGSTTLPVKEILKMGEGTIVELDTLAGEPVNVKANGILIAKGEVVVIDENFGVRVTEIVGSVDYLKQSENKQSEPQEVGG